MFIEPEWNRRLDIDNSKPQAAASCSLWLIAHETLRRGQYMSNDRRSSQSRHSNDC